MALFKVLRGSSTTIDRNSATKPPFIDGYAYFTPDDSRFYIDVQLDTAPAKYFDSGVVNGKTIYRIEVESFPWDELYTMVQGKADNPHYHEMSDISNGVQGIYYVPGTQAAKTSSWTGALPTVSQLYDGLTIAYYLPYASTNTAVQLQLQLSGNTTSWIPVYYTNNSAATTHYGAGAVINLTYANGAWRHANYVDGNTIPATSVATASTTTDKVGSHTYYTARPNSHTLVTLRYANTVQGPITLDINSTGAKPIYINGQASSATNYTLPAGTYLVFYDGTNYYFDTQGMIPGNVDIEQITGLAQILQTGTGSFTESGMTINADIQADWAQTDSTTASYIKNKPTILNIGITIDDDAQTMFITSPIENGDGVSY